jgi:hypothetical protein
VTLCYFSFLQYFLISSHTVAEEIPVTVKKKRPKRKWTENMTSRKKNLYIAYPIFLENKGFLPTADVKRFRPRFEEPLDK